MDKIGEHEESISRIYEFYETKLRLKQGEPSDIIKERDEALKAELKPVGKLLLDVIFPAGKKELPMNEFLTRDWGFSPLNNVIGFIPDWLLSYIEKGLIPDIVLQISYLCFYPKVIAPKNLTKRGRN